jgi:hypothetical protein
MNNTKPIYSTIILLIVFTVGLSQTPSLRPAEVVSEPLSVTNRGINIIKQVKGNGQSVTPGSYVFCTFSIKYRDSILHSSGAIPMDNVVFVPLEYEKNPNVAIYEVFTFLKDGDNVYFDIPFRMLPWKDARLGENDTIRYSIQIDSVKNEAEYLILYDQFLRDEELKLEKNADWVLSLKQDIRVRLELFDQKSRLSGFVKHPEGYWYAALRPGEGASSDKMVLLRYMMLFRNETSWDEKYFNPSKLQVGLGDAQLSPFLEKILTGMKPGQRDLIFIPGAMAKSLGLHTEEVTGDLCFYLERLPFTDEK